MQPGRGVAAIVAVVGAVAFLALAVVLVPWDPIPGPALHAPPASSVFSAAEIERAEAFSGPQRLLSWASLAVSLLLACVLGFTPLGARLVARVPGRWWWRVLVSASGLLLAGRIATAPFSVVLRHRAREYGLSNQSWDGFALDMAKGFAIEAVVTSAVLLLVVGAARRWPKVWPAIVGCLLAALVMVGSFVYPLLVEPLFNDFEPLPHGELRSQILSLADREGVELDEVLVADASRRTTRLNAYVSGYGASHRVVVYDTLIDAEAEREVLSVIAHELAHARHNDVLVGSVLGAAAALTGVGLLGMLVGGVGDPRRIPRVLALFAVATLLASPVQNSISRRVETRADVAALNATADPEGFITLQRDLARTSLADPTPYRISHFWFGSHPTALHRIALAQRLGHER